METKVVRVRSHTGRLQVADALADNCMQRWAQILGQRVLETDWSCAISSHSMQAALLSLPVNVRVDVLQYALSTQKTPSGPLYVANGLPSSLHPHVVGAMIVESGMLTCPCKGYASLHVLLAQLPMLPSLGLPPLRALLIAAQPLDHDAAHLLSQALPFHSQMSSLELRVVEEPKAAARITQRLIPALAAATHLQSLKISTNHPIFPTEIVSFLSQCVGRLKHLATLSMCRSYCQVLTRPDNESYSLTEAEQQKHWSTFLQAAASHRCLTSLSFRCENICKPLPWPCVLPRLLELSIACAASTSPPQHSTRPMPATQHASWPQLPALTKLEFLLSAAELEVNLVSHHWLPFRTDTVSCPKLRVLRLEILPGTHATANDTDVVLWKKVLVGVIPGSQCCVLCVLPGHVSVVHDSLRRLPIGCGHSHASLWRWLYLNQHR